MWEWYKVDSLHAYGDYDEASMFSYAAAKVVESFFKFGITKDKKVIYHANEWMTGLGLLYIQHELPKLRLYLQRMPQVLAAALLETTNHCIIIYGHTMAIKWRMS